LVTTKNEAFLARKIIEAFRRPELGAAALERNRALVEEKGALRGHARRLSDLYANCFR